MIDKIIEELECECEKYHDFAEEDMNSDYWERYEAYKEAIEIVKKYDNDGWVLCNDRLPTIETTQFNNVQYLTSYGESCQVLPYCDGWNCFRDYTGYVSKSNEVESVVAWKEIKPYIRKGDN